MEHIICVGFINLVVVVVVVVVVVGAQGQRLALSIEPN
jgi:hypothetical protein